MRMLLASVAVAALLSASALAAPPAPGAPAAPLHLFDGVAVSPDGSRIASIEAEEPANPALDPSDTIVLRPVGGGPVTRVALPCTGPECHPSSLAWSPDGKMFAFVLTMPKQKQQFVYAAAVDGTAPPRRLLAFDGTLDGLRYGPGGVLAMLATPGAHKQPGATQAGAPLSGEIGETEDEQRIATLGPDGHLTYRSPPNLYVYQYDWRPDPAGSAPRFVGTAAPGNGDDQWWVAKLYAFGDGAPRVLYAPPPKRQLADPVVSPDGTAVAFIGGIMSDFGATGGNAFRVSLQGPPGAPTALQDLTPNLKGSVTALSWSCTAPGAAPQLLGLTLMGADEALLRIGGADPGGALWRAPVTLLDTGHSLGVSCGGGVAAAVRQSFTEAPELVTAHPQAAFADWTPLTHLNVGHTVKASVRSLDWHSDQFEVQGWLLSPAGAPTDPNGPKGPMITVVHGGPAWANVPHFMTARGTELGLLHAGYRVFLPNPRGSFGQGEAFTAANVRDFGYGDLRDILSGIDAAEKAAPVDDARLGIMGYSYGGYMTMWAVTQTNRFKAAVAGAGVSDWESYYGENGIDQWMIPYFGASVYDDPAIYARSSPMTFIKRVHTPTFEFVGDRDVECPLPQTQEFYHALHELGVPTEFVVYPGQGHGMRDPADWADAQRRTIAWFNRYLAPKGGS